MKQELKPEDIKVGHCYEAKKPAPVGLYGLINDRQIIYIGSQSVQYDSPSVRNGGHYPSISMEKFLKWAGRDVTELMPKDDWRIYERKS